MKDPAEQKKDCLIKKGSRQDPKCQTGQNRVKKLQDQKQRHMTFFQTQDMIQTEFFLPALQKKAVRIKQKDQRKKTHNPPAHTEDFHHKAAAEHRGYHLAFC